MDGGEQSKYIEITTENVGKFKKLVESLSEFQEPRLRTMLGGFLAELFTIFRLVEELEKAGKFNEWSIMWYGGKHKGTDIELKGPNKKTIGIQVKGSTEIDDPNFIMPIKEVGKSQKGALFQVKLEKIGDHTYQYPEEPQRENLTDRIWVLAEIKGFKDRENKLYISNEKTIADIAFKHYKDWLENGEIKNVRNCRGKRHNEKSLDCRIRPKDQDTKEFFESALTSDKWQLLIAEL